MGLALARAAMHRGAIVTLVHAPVTEKVPTGIRAASVVSAAQMQQAMLSYFSDADITVMAAAVADVKPADYATQKVPKRFLPEALPVEPVPDILAELGQHKQPHQRLIGFAAQTGEIVAPALEKLKTKKLDAIAANPIDQPNMGFGSEMNRAILLDKQGRHLEIEPCSKLQLAHHLLDFVQAMARD
jgi:phosphopantothenoylcysteine decarboxylase/phosphopantothenate--cysteine ligase